MSRLTRAVQATDGRVRLVAAGERWTTATLIADAFPLERPARFPRPVRRVGHCTRLVLFDQALTDPGHRAVLTISGTRPWGPVLALVVVVALLLPRTPRWVRRSSIVGVGTWAWSDDRLRRAVGLQRELWRVAPDAFVVGDLVARVPGRAASWIDDVLGGLAKETTLAAVLPVAAQARRQRARERLYTERFGFRVATRTRVCGEELTILVR
jgi:hypothetical protein